jgi:two-component system response regulator GlrR
MNGMDGMALFEAIHREQPTLPVIILTAHGTIPDAVQATQMGVFGFLTKPVDKQELLAGAEGALRISGFSERRRGLAQRDHHPQRADGRACSRRPTWSPAPTPRADHRRERHRQGAAGARDPQGEPARHKPFVAINCGDGRGAARVRAVRPREGRLHRRRSSSTRACSRPPRAAR